MDMFRIEAVCVCALFVGATGIAAVAPVAAQERTRQVSARDEEGDGPEPVDSTRSISAAEDDDIRERARSDERASQAAGAPGHPSGSYAGVVPGTGKQAPPAAKAARASNAPTITWPGFQMRPDGSSRVFIQSTSALDPKVLTAAGGKFELQLPRARIAAKTNRLPLDTRFFNTPVTKVSVSSDNGGAVVQLELRAAITPSVSSEPGPPGYFFTYIELPKGDYLTRIGAGSGVPLMLPPKPASKVIGKPAASVSTGESSSSVRGDASVRAGIGLGR